VTALDLTGSGYDREPASSRLELVQVGRGTPYGEVLRRYWHQVALASLRLTAAPAGVQRRQGRSGPLNRTPLADSMEHGCGSSPVSPGRA
jgi:hypothetical protein